MLAADTFERLGIPRGDYVLKVNNRKVLDGVMESIGLAGPEHADGRLTVLRAIDKLDRLGVSGVKLLLGAGRKDESGDFTKGAGLNESQVAKVIGYVSVEAAASGRATVAQLRSVLEETEIGRAGLDELDQIAALVDACGYGADRIRIDPSVVRGLEYYTGPVFEAELTFKVTGDDGQPVRFGSVGGGGRYDDLVARFTGQRVPATGFSIGVSRLLSALKHLKKDEASAGTGPVVVLVMDRKELPRYQRLAQRLREAGVVAEMYLGTSGMKAQMKYADRRDAPCVVIQGGDELAKGEIQIKDLIEGAKAAATIKDAKEWREGRPAQFSVPEDQLVSAVKGVLARHSSP
jgi:histidyl-tRNA synthetase